MLKFIVVIALALAITGCSATITSGELQRAAERCKDKGGVNTIYAPTLFAITDFTLQYSANCNNGDNVLLNRKN